MPNKTIIFLKQSKNFNKILKMVTKITYSYYLNLKNRYRYGPSAPKFGEIIWVDPLKVNKFLKSRIIEKMYGVRKHLVSGRVIESFWPVEQETRIMDNTIVMDCIDHWINGLPWEDTRNYKHMLKRVEKKGTFMGCKNINDIAKRYENLDNIFAQAKRERSLRVKKDINIENFRKGNEAIVHIGPGGELIKGNSGMHRFAIAYILRVAYPAQIGLVHVSAIPMLKEFRK